MRSRTSFFSRRIVLDDMRRIGWVGVVHTFALLFMLPLKIVMLYSREDADMKTIRELFYYRSEHLQALLILTVPVLLGILLFRYIQVRIESDMLHSLPVKREILYRSHVLTGVTILLLPVLVAAGTALVLNGALGLERYYTAGDVLQWVGVTGLMSLFLFIACVFVGMNVGISVVQGVLTYVMIFLPEGLTLLMSSNLRIFLYGYISDSDRLLEKLSPITRILNGFAPGTLDAGRTDIMGPAEIAVYAVLCIALFFLAQFLYKKRRLEAASQTIVFKELHHIFIYGVTFCMMMLGGLYFQATQRTIRWVLFGYVIGSFTGYFAARMLIEKTFWVFRKAKGYALYAGVILLIMAGIKLDIFGYESYIPDPNGIESVYFNGYINDQYPDYFEKKNIERIYALHQQLIRDRGRNKYSLDMNANGLVFTYQLKNGKRINRGYSVDYADYAGYLKPIYESREYKEMHYEILNAAASDIEKITISPDIGVNKAAVIIDPADIAEALQILKSEIYNEAYEQMTDYKEAWARMSFMVADGKTDKYSSLNNSNTGKKNNQLNAAWEKSYKQFEAWLDKKGYLKNARALPEDIAYVVVEKIEDKEEWKARRRQGDIMDESGNGKRLEITDKDRIEACLQNYSVVWGTEYNEYVLGFYRNDKRCIEYGSFREEDAPDFVKAFFH